jgi:hypothetical protein
MTLSEAISAGSLVISAIALIWAIKGVNASRKATQLQVFDGIFREIKKLDAQYISEFKTQGIQPTKVWCYDFFNTLEYLAFLINRNMILRDELHAFYSDAVRAWHVTFSENSSTKDLNDPDFYSEFKKLYRTVKG